MNEDILSQKLKYVNTKRLTSYWEPVYNPNGDNIEKSAWDFSGITGVSHRLYEANDLYSSAESFIQSTFRGISFLTCDFRGNFVEKKITFNSCNFKNCDFGYSTWKNVKFSGCKFANCSFTLIQFTDSQFLDCEWDTMGFQEMKLDFLIPQCQIPNNL